MYFTGSQWRVDYNDNGVDKSSYFTLEADAVAFYKEMQPFK